MNAISSIAVLVDDLAVVAIRHPLMPTLYREDLLAGTVGLMIPPHLMNDDRYEVGRDCKTCSGRGHRTVYCKRCNGTGVIWGKEGIKEICCSGNDQIGCPDCEGGTIWNREG